MYANASDTLVFMTCDYWIRPAVLGAAVVLLTAAPRVRADTRSIDTARSTLTVFVYKSGLFSAFADNHIIKAPIASGSLSTDPAAAIELSIHAANLMVMDPDLSRDRRNEVQARMVGPEVLDVARFPDITFASTTIVETAPARWSVTGRLTIHGQTRVVTFPVRNLGDAYTGDVTISQHDFGIEPIRIAGGAVKVKDELKIAFQITASNVKLPQALPPAAPAER
jgi:polyisoprenoid-binding protein YceI